VLLAGILLWFLYFAFGQGTNINYESSDGNWRDGESLSKSRGFEAVLFYFEQYRLKCNSEAELYRVTDREDATFTENLFNRYSKLKWQVPYREPALTSVYNPECYNVALTAEERQLIEGRVKQYLRSGKSHNKSPQPTAEGGG